MANKTTANAFMASAQKSKREMADIQKEGSGKHETDEVELKKISLLIPAWLHKEAQLHRVETGESMTKLIVRLLAEELGYGDGDEGMGLMVTESEKSKHDMLRAMRKHIRENGITDFTDFQDWCDENNDCWSQALDSGLSSVIEKYIDGRFY